MIERTSSTLGKIDSKTMRTDEGGDSGKRSKTLSEVKPVKREVRIRSFSGIRPAQKKVFLSHKLRDHAYE